MNAAVLHTLNQPPLFQQFPEPVAEENEVIVHVRAAALKPVDKQLASGSHYAAHGKLPVVCGMDGVGHLDDGTRVFFGGPRPPYGSWRNALSCRGRAVFRSPTTLTMTSPQLW